VKVRVVVHSLQVGFTRRLRGFRTYSRTRHRSSPELRSPRLMSHHAECDLVKRPREHPVVKGWWSGEADVRPPSAPLAHEAARRSHSASPVRQSIVALTDLRSTSTERTRFFFPWIPVATIIPAM